MPFIEGLTVVKTPSNSQLNLGREKALLVALLWVRLAPTSRLGPSLYEILSGRPFDTLHELGVPDGVHIRELDICSVFNLWEILCYRSLLPAG